MLNDIEIKSYVEKKQIISENYDELSLTPNGYDLRIEDIKPGNKIMSNHVFFVSTYEKLNLPDNITGSLFIKSRYSRKGIFSSFGFVDAGFKGNLTLTFYNAGDDIAFKKYEKIAQIVFYQINTPEKNYENRSGNYQNSSGMNLK